MQEWDLLRVWDSAAIEKVDKPCFSLCPMLPFTFFKSVALGSRLRVCPWGWVVNISEHHASIVPPGVGRGHGIMGMLLGRQKKQRSKKPGMASWAFVGRPKKTEIKKKTPVHLKPLGPPTP